MVKKRSINLRRMALVPHDIWSSNVLTAQKEGRTFLYSSNNYFNEFTPPIIEEESTLTIFRSFKDFQAYLFPLKTSS